ncbi:S1 RNA-binding domain-containing protein [Spiroplasma culicicola]|uniref:S1 motif domain-containing protein n=1 Tax=Spiroplasma culicicola AES-1 TaxID=1276246 RepID=W6A784_9MOLU|nr:S1 RNA-binding domain-containing protein [Spiroplasma culicicola]AHI52841.1 hypothetical protein SCULI_v1c05000 [Spiroplasma culicicola AES-1]
MRQTVKVTITNIVNFGAFCDVTIDGKVYNGLIHISEITDGYVANVSDHLSVGETVDGYVISVDESKNQAKISLKNAQ